MSRFYTPPEAIQDKDIVLTDPAEIHHIINVMRLKVGDVISTFDGSGREYEGEIEEVAPKRVLIKIVKIKETKQAPVIHITLAQAIPKLDKMDYIVEKATELGVSYVIPILTERTVVRLDGERAQHKLARWTRIAQAAAKQCGRTTGVKVSPIAQFDKVLEALRGRGLRMIFCLSPEARPLKEILSRGLPKEVAVFIGPEGDFTPAEIRRAQEAGFVPASLGGFVLRTDTAALSVLSILNYIESY